MIATAEATEIRVRTKVPDEIVREMKGQNPSDHEYDVLLTGDAKVFKPNGELLCVYRQDALDGALLNASYEALHDLKKYETNNRGLASGTKRAQLYAGTRTYSKPVASAIIGSIDAKPPYEFCRLTSWTGKETEKFSSLFPLFQAIGEGFAREVPDRFKAQMRYISKTKEEWVVPGTPFTTITVNNTYSTGVHTDKGDLNEGFSNLVVLRRGQPFSGGRLVFPQYRVAVDMAEGDLLLMDAHEYHGNTPLQLNEGSERISIVCYYRTKMKECGTGAEEQEKMASVAAKRSSLGDDPKADSSDPEGA